MYFDVTREELLAMLSKYEQDASLRSLATKAGISYASLVDFKRGKSAMLGDKNLRSVMLVLRPQEESSIGTATVSIVGYVGAGDVVDCSENTGDVLEEVPCPPGINSETGKGYIVRGDSGEPYIYNGWCIFINRCFPGMVPEYVNELCIVKISEGNGEHSGKVMLKIVRKGSKAGYYTLESLNPNSKPIKDVVIEESCVIDAMIPRRQFKKL